MKHLKYLILHQTIWGLAFGTLFCLMKPLFLVPAPAGIPLGIGRENGSFILSKCLITVIALCAINYSGGIAVTTINRYILAFPSKITNYLNSKIVIRIAIPFYVAFYGAIGIITVKDLSQEVGMNFESARSYDEFFVNFNESSLIFIPIEYATTYGYFISITLIMILLTAIAIIIIFIYLVRSTTTQAVTKMQSSMIMSSVVEISLICMLLIAPTIVAWALFIFQIPNCAWCLVIIACLLASHGAFACVSTMYFVLPYRRYLKQQILKILFSQHQILAVVKVSPNPSFRRSESLAISMSQP